MICPNCLKNAEIAYSAMSESLICLEPGCSWERRMDENETFELFFGSRKVRESIGERFEARESLVQKCAS